MKKIIIFIVIILFTTIISSFNTYAYTTNDTLKEQQQEFGISDFIKNSKEYTGEFFENIDINTFFNDAIKGRD